MSGIDAEKLLKRFEDDAKQKIFNPLLGKILTYAVAIAEENQRMGRIVACPTAGSCGIVPSTIIAVSEQFNLNEDKQIEALILVAGLGQLIAQEVPLAGAVAGCQAECGVAAAMAAAGVTYLMDGTNSEIINSAALALKNILGLVCDPVAGLVEVPCIKRNGFLAIHAITAAECALAGIKSVIPLEEIVQALKEIGDAMHPSLKETSKGGLAVTPTAEKLSLKR
jgi:L-serine dehydratase